VRVIEIAAAFAVTEHKTQWIHFFAILLLPVLTVLTFIFCRRVYAREREKRFDEIFQERTYSVRDHQDSVLQTIQASRLLTADALEHLGDQQRTRKALNLLAGWLDRASVDSHAVLRALEHPASATNDFVEALRDAANECCSEQPMKIRISTVGHKRKMHSVARDEIYRIAYEAIRNACRHSRAQEMQIEIEYKASFHIRIRDNGRGMESEPVQTNTGGNFGLAGMRARATFLGGRLDIQSNSGAGTTVSLVVPGRVAFRDPYERMWHWTARKRRTSGNVP
jgi:signal transduction histidine kinase